MYQNIRRQLIGLYSPSLKLRNKIQPELSLRNIEAQPAIDFIANFQKNIIKPIAIIEELYSNRMPQKCFTHNLSLSLYCKTQHHGVCPECINKYNNKHRGHRLIPLNNAIQQIKEGVNAYGKRIQRTISHIKQAIGNLNQKIGNAEREEEQMYKVIQSYFSQLYNSIRQREDELLAEIQFQNRKVKCQRVVASANLKKSIEYTEKMLKKYQKIDEDHLTTLKLNVYEHLNKLDKYANHQLQDYMNQIQINFNAAKLEKIMKQFKCRQAQLLEKVKEASQPNKNVRNKQQSFSKSLEKSQLSHKNTKSSQLFSKGLNKSQKTPIRDKAKEGKSLKGSVTHNKSTSFLK